MVEETQQAIQVQLSADQQTEMSYILNSWIDYFYKPLVFPHLYFPHYKPTMKFRMLKGYLPQLYKGFKDLFVPLASNVNTYNAWQTFSLSQERMEAERFFDQVWYYVDYCYENSEAVKKLREMEAVPLAGRLVVLFNEATTKDQRMQSEKVKLFIHDLWLKECGTFLKHLGVSNGDIATGL